MKEVRAGPRSFFAGRLSLTVSFGVFLLAAAGFAAAYIVGGAGYAIRSLLYAIPLVAAGAVIRVLTRTGKAGKSVKSLQLRGISMLHLVLMTIFVFIISLIVLASFPTRPWSYFVAISILAGLIFAQIIFIDRQPPSSVSRSVTDGRIDAPMDRSKGGQWIDYLVLLEITLLSLNVTWGVSLKYPLYFGSTDTLVHLSYIQTIVQSGHVSGMTIDYQNYPLFHIFNAMGVEVTGLSLRTGLFILMGIAWQVGIVFAYLIFRRLSNSRSFSLLACLIFASTSELLYYGSYAVTRSLAFVFVLVFLYLVLQKAKVPYILCSILTIGTLIIVHHATALFFAPVLIIFSLFQNFNNRGGRLDTRIQSSAVQLYVTSFFAYTFYVAYSFSIPAMRHWYQSLISAESVALGTVTHAATPTSLYYAFVLFLCVIGIAMAFLTRRSDQTHASIARIGFPTAVFLLFYLPGPLDVLPQSGVALLYRLPLLVSPFVAYFVAYGTDRLVSYERAVGRRPFDRISTFPLVSLSLVVLTAFFSTISGANANDNSYVVRASAVSSPFFTDSELTSFSFAKNYCNTDSNLYSDLQTWRNELYFNQFKLKRIIRGGNINYIQSGYLVFRSGELERAHGLDFSPTESEAGVYRYYPEPSNTQTDITSILSTRDRLYSDGDVQIYFVDQNEDVNK